MKDKEACHLSVFFCPSSGARSLCRRGGRASRSGFLGSVCNVAGCYLEALSPITGWVAVTPNWAVETWQEMRRILAWKRRSSKE
jgi:hypothetical protein